MTNEIEKGIVTLVIALIGAVVGTLLRLHKYKREKRWEARYAAYQAIFLAISDIYTWVEEAYANAKLLPALNNKKLSELSSQFHSARHLLWRYARIGNLIISNDSLAAIDSLLHDIEGERFQAEEEPYDETNHDEVLSDHCEKLRAIISTHLPHIMRHAKADLK